LTCYNPSPIYLVQNRPRLQRLHQLMFRATLQAKLILRPLLPAPAKLHHDQANRANQLAYFYMNRYDMKLACPARFERAIASLQSVVCVPSHSGALADCLQPQK
jgi:hypothetical protein